MALKQFMTNFISLIKTKNILSHNDKIKRNIRKADFSDSKFICECIKKGREEKHFYGAVFAREKIKNLIEYNSATNEFFIFENENNEKVGFAYCGFQERYYGFEINMLYILENYRHIGITTDFIKYYEKYIYNNYNEGNKFIARCDINNSKEAIALFKKMGYKKISEEKTAKYTFDVLMKTYIARNYI